MDTTKKSSHPRFVLTQTHSNTTLWIGHLHSDPTEHFGGQTFTCPSDGQLASIELYASAVQYPGSVYLSLHEFDPSVKVWGRSLGESSVEITRANNEQWVRFQLPGVYLNKSSTYGFRIHSNNAMVGLGEAACDNQHPFTFGHEWNADSKNQAGSYYLYFSLAFRIEMN